MDLGKIVRTMREKEGLSQAELSRKSGVSQSQISLIEANKSTPSMIAMLRIADALDYDIVFNPRYKGGYK